MEKSKTILYIAMSLDGYIASEDGGIGWLSIAEWPGEDYGYGDFIRGVGTVIMGKKTYEKVLSLGVPFPHRDKKCYVLSSSRSGQDENVIFYSGSMKELIQAVKLEHEGNIFIDGGAETVHALLQENLIEECVISILPVLLGGGIKLFREGRAENRLQLISSKSFPSGLAQLHYACPPPMPDNLQKVYRPASLHRMLCGIYTALPENFRKGRTAGITFP